MFPTIHIDGDSITDGEMRGVRVNGFVVVGPQPLGFKLFHEDSPVLFPFHNFKTGQGQLLQPVQIKPRFAIPRQIDGRTIDSGAAFVILARSPIVIVNAALSDMDVIV